ncbi:hypothetical protein [Bordetella genomosp. 7]|uniref:Uncharacterized protein n=1 Tax=Bordetella genomosp. 7 TaxID=1416805 RepID=A0A261R0V2_9BORD|nr:hypothetical protein [Bordetella genomosp. 7]OZI17963.1 hypothetical protein CAL19_12855 [Bordetella genomosp. 7]
MAVNAQELWDLLNDFGNAAQGRDWETDAQAAAQNYSNKAANLWRGIIALLDENEALSKQVEELREEGAAAVRWAPSSAHWSCELKRLFGDDARQGIDALEKRLRYAQAENHALRGERDVLADILRDALGPLQVDLLNAEADGDCEDSRDLRAIIDRAEAALNPPAPPQGDGA